MPGSGGAAKRRRSARQNFSIPERAALRAARSGTNNGFSSGRPNTKIIFQSHAALKFSNCNMKCQNIQSLNPKKICNFYLPWLFSSVTIRREMLSDERGGRELHSTMQPLDFSSNLVDPASSHMLVSKTKPCTSKYKLNDGETANGSLQRL